MKKYISEIHTKSPEHKKRFAFLVSLGFTMIIFSVWAFVKFNDLSDRRVVAENNQQMINKITPISNITDGIANSLRAIKSTANDLKSSFEQVNLQNQYEMMRREALPTDNQNGSINTTNTNGQ